MMFSCVFHFKLNDRFGEAISLKLFFVNVLLLSFALCRIVVWRKLTIVLCFREQDLVWFILTGAISNFPIRKLLNLPISQPLGSTVRHQHSRLAAYLLPSWFASALLLGEPSIIESCISRILPQRVLIWMLLFGCGLCCYLCCMSDVMWNFLGVRTRWGLET